MKETATNKTPDKDVTKSKSPKAGAGTGGSEYFEMLTELHELRESNERFLAMMNSFEGFVYVCSSDYRIEFMNNKMIERTGHDATGEFCYKALHNMDYVCSWCVNERVFKGEQVRWEVQSPKDNRWYQIVNTPVYHRDGRISKQALIFDITERRHAEEHLERLFTERTTELRKTNDLLLWETSERKRAGQALKKAYRQLQDIINFLPDATFVIDKNKKVIAWNRAIEEMTGVKREDILGKGDYAYAVPFYGEKREIIIDLVMGGQSETPKKYDVITGSKDGTVYGEAHVPKLHGGKGAYLWGIASPLFDPGGNVIGAIQSIRDITGRKEAEKEIKESEKQLRFLSSRLLMVQEEERRRVAGDLHDTLGQYLVALKLRLETILCSRTEGYKDDRAGNLQALVPMIQDALEELRRICMGLRPSILDSLGIVATIGWFCRQFEANYEHIGIRQQLGVEEDDVPEHLKIIIFRIVQEALSNVAKHSRARLVNLSIEKAGSALELTIMNDGPGFDVDDALGKKVQERGFGLTGMRERAELSGGSFSIRSSNEDGTVIKVSWPCNGTISK
jgi:PAS domain S-box-containing protein